MRRLSRGMPESAKATAKTCALSCWRCDSNALNWPCDNCATMGPLRSLRYCLLALTVALVQLMVPISGYAHMAKSNALMLDICTAGGSHSGGHGGDDPDSGGVGDAVQHCCQCTGVSTFLAPSIVNFAFPCVLPSTSIRVGKTLYQSGSAVFVPPATGPPALA